MCYVTLLLDNRCLVSAKLYYRQLILQPKPSNVANVRRRMPISTEGAIQRQYVREGHFASLNNFMVQDGGADIHLTKADYKEAATFTLQRGHIIHVLDDDVHIDTRVMVVLRDGVNNYTCLTMCFHWQSLDPPDHWRVAKAGDVGRRPPTDTLPQLTVKLQVARPDGTVISTLKPKPNITINILESWNVQRQVHVVVLGKVEETSFRRLVDAHLKSYSRSIDNRAWLPPVSPTPVTSATSVSNQRRSSRSGHSFRSCGCDCRHYT